MRGLRTVRAEQRHALILEMLTVSGRVEMPDLRAALDVSEMTIRRDLADLESQGALRRVHGGATRPVSGSYEAPFAVRSQLRREAKRAIAQAAADRIADGGTVILDGGSTGLFIAEFLLDKVVTVCPLSLRAAFVLAASPTVRLLMPGGFVRPGEQTLTGAEAILTLNEHLFDDYVMTVSGVSASSGFTEWNPEDAAVKRAAIANSRNCIAVFDSSKYGQAAFSRVAPLSAANVIVTDSGLSATGRAELASTESELVIVAQGAKTTTPRDGAPVAPDAGR
jgi:DeoR family transcriptional regulator, fructose operon transcriptional repressor